MHEITVSRKGDDKQEESILKYRPRNNRSFALTATAGRMTQARAVWTQMMGISKGLNWGHSEHDWHFSLTLFLTGHFTPSLCPLVYSAHTLHAVLHIIRPLPLKRTIIFNTDWSNGCFYASSPVIAVARGVMLADRLSASPILLNNISGAPWGTSFKFENFDKNECSCY